MVERRLQFYLIAFGFLFLVPLLTDSPYVLTILIMSLIQLVLTSSLTVSNGYLGLFNAGQIAFFGIGGYISAMISIQGSIPWVANIFITGLVTVVFSLLVGIPGMRVRGAFFAVITLASMMAAWIIVLAWAPVTGGALGIPRIPRPEIFGILIVSRTSYYLLYLVITAISFLVLYFLISSRVGRTFTAIREDEALARSFGVNITMYKLLGFAISSFFAGIGGAMYVSFHTYVDPLIFNIYYLITVLAMAALGYNLLEGVFITSFALTILPEFLRMTVMLRETIYGIILIALTILPAILKERFKLSTTLFQRRKQNVST